jgi:hypothetical protein
MVSFTRIAYATAFERGEIQRRIIRTLSSEISDTESVDYALASQLIQQQLEPLNG